MKQPNRDWNQAIDKVQAEGLRCRVCKSQNMVQCAHIIGREHDKDVPLRTIKYDGDGNVDTISLAWTDQWQEHKGYMVYPDRIVPLCKRCHDKYDAHKLDLLPYLSLWEVLQAVADSAHGRGNGLEAARIRITGMMEVPA